MKRKSYISIFTVISLVFAAVSFLILQLSKKSTALADFMNSTVCMWIRRAFALISDRVSFSIFEVLICLIPLAIVLIIIISVRRFKRGEGRIKYILNLLAVALIIYSLYVFTLAIPYRTTRLEDNIGLPSTEVDAASLYNTSKILIDEINAIAPVLERGDGIAIMPYGMDALSEKLSSSYRKAAEERKLFPAFSSRAKPIRASGVMSSLGLLGIYTFFTGESNINVAYPAYDRPFTTAHEFAHQRGIIREDEANFIAFLVCIESDDDFIKYSGYLGLYEYIRSALYRADKELFREADAALCSEATADMRASYAVSEKYAGSTLGKISDTLNDFYLKQNGTEGIASYGLVTRLAVAYYSDSAR